MKVDLPQIAQFDESTNHFFLFSFSNSFLTIFVCIISFKTDTIVFHCFCIIYYISLNTLFTEKKFDMNNI